MRPPTVAPRGFRLWRGISVNLSRNTDSSGLRGRSVLRVRVIWSNRAV